MHLVLYLQMFLLQFLLLAPALSLQICNQDISLKSFGQTGRISSPNYPHNYSTNANCKYAFMNDNLGDTLRLCFNFLRFGTPSPEIANSFVQFTNVGGSLGLHGNIRFYDDGKLWIRGSGIQYPAEAFHEEDSLVPTHVHQAPICQNVESNDVVLLEFMSDRSGHEDVGFEAIYTVFRVRSSSYLAPNCSLNCTDYRFEYTSDGEQLCQCKHDNAAPCRDTRALHVCHTNSKTCVRPCVYRYACGGRDWLGSMDSSFTYETARCSSTYNYRRLTCTFDKLNWVHSAMTCDNRMYGSNRPTETIRFTDHTKSGVVARAACIVFKGYGTGIRSLILNTVQMGGYADLGTVCVRFWWNSYNFVQRNRDPSSFLRVVAKSYSNSIKVVWIGHTHYRNNDNRTWQLVEFEYSSASWSTSFAIERYIYYTDNRYIGTVLLDDISVAPGRCQLSNIGHITGCMFDENTCGWWISGGRSGKGWSIVRRRRDHTCETLSSRCGLGGYMRLQVGSSGFFIFGSTEIQHNIQNPRCLSFWYRTNSFWKTRPILSVKRVFSDSRKGNLTTVITLDDSSSWKFFNVTLSAIVKAGSPYHIELVYSSYYHQEFRLEIDDLHVLEGTCDMFYKNFYYPPTRRPWSTWRPPTPWPTRRYNCAYNEWRCNSGHCIHEVLRCNGIDNCSDGSDEHGCPSRTSERLSIVAIVVGSVGFVLLLACVIACVNKKSNSVRNTATTRPSSHPPMARESTSAAPTSDLPPTYSMILRESAGRPSLNNAFVPDESPPSYEASIEMLENVAPKPPEAESST